MLNQKNKMKPKYGEDYSERVIRDIVKYARDTNMLINDIEGYLNGSKMGGQGGTIYLTRIAYDVCINLTPDNDPGLDFLKKERKRYCEEIDDCETGKGYSPLITEGIDIRAEKIIGEIKTLEQKLKGSQ